MYWPWYATLLVCLSPLILLLLWVPFSLLLESIQRQYYARRCVNTEDFVMNRMGLIVYICGNIGAGKTTMGSALTNVLSKIKRMQAQMKIQEILDIFWDMDFNQLDSLIHDCFFVLHFTNSRAIINYLVDHQAKFKELFGDKWYDNYLSLTSCKDLLRDYIDAQMALYRNNYVYFPRRRFYSRITKSFAMDFTPDRMDIKDRLINKDYSLQKYTVIFEDEKTLSSNNIDDIEEKQKDGGKEKFLRLIRQMFKGTTHYICTAQDFDRDVKKDRELATSIFYIAERKEKHVVTPLRPFYSIIVRFCDDLLLYYSSILNQIQDFRNTSYLNQYQKVLHKKVEDRVKNASEKEPSYWFKKVAIYNKIAKVFVDAKKKQSKVRHLRHEINQRMNKTFAKDFIRYRGVLYYKADDVGKNPKDCDAVAFDFTFPITFAYGSTDTYQYSVIQDYLMDQSMEYQDFYDPRIRKIPSSDLDNGSKYIEDLLKKRKKKEKRGQDGEIPVY